jgi:hypothetical protein
MPWEEFLKNKLIVDPYQQPGEEPRLDMQALARLCLRNPNHSRELSGLMIRQMAQPEE